MKLHIGGDFARGRRSHNRLGGAVRPRKHLLESSYLRLSIRTILTEISLVAALPGNPKRPTLMKASFQRADLCLRRAVERNIEVIGEAMNRILKSGAEVQITNSRKIVDARNYIIHGYDSLSVDILWSIVINHLPKLKAEVTELLK